MSMSIKKSSDYYNESDVELIKKEITNYTEKNNYLENKEPKKKEENSSDIIPNLQNQHEKKGQEFIFNQLNEPHQLIYFGTSGVGKSYLINEKIEFYSIQNVEKIVLNKKMVLIACFDTKKR